MTLWLPNCLVKHGTLTPWNRMYKPFCIQVNLIRFSYKSNLDRHTSFFIYRVFFKLKISPYYTITISIYFHNLKEGGEGGRLIFGYWTNLRGWDKSLGFWQKLWFCEQFFFYFILKKTSLCNNLVYLPYFYVNFKYIIFWCILRNNSCKILIVFSRVFLETSQL